MSDSPEHNALDDAIRAAVRVDDEEAIVIGWTLVVAQQRVSDPARTAVGYFCAEGQPSYATVGLLSVGADLVQQTMYADEEEDYDDGDR